MFYDNIFIFCIICIRLIVCTKQYRQYHYYGNANGFFLLAMNIPLLFEHNHFFSLSPLTKSKKKLCLKNNKSQLLLYYIQIFLFNIQIFLFSFICSKIIFQIKISVLITFFCQLPLVSHFI